jgi:hypothetical protein
MGFVENVNKVANDLTIELAENVNIVAGIADDVSQLVDLYNEGQLPLIDDTVPSADKVYSSLQTQTMHDAQAEAIGNLASASGSLVKTGVPVVLTSTFQDLSFATNVQSSNPLVFEIGTNNMILKSNGDYNFFSIITVQLSSGQTQTILFEVYDTVNATVLASSTGTVNQSNGDIIVFPINTLMSVQSVPYDGQLTVKVRAKLTAGSATTVTDFSSMMVLSGAASSGGQLLGKAPMKAVAYLAGTTSEVLVTPDGSNNFSIDSLVIEDGGSLTVSNNSIYKVL